MNVDEAREAAKGELGRDSELLGHEIVAGPGHETPGYWVFYPNRPTAFESLQAAESLSYRIPPLVVNKVTGVVTRPVAAGSMVRAIELGQDQWFIARPPAHKLEHESLDGLKLSGAEVAAIERLEHFRVRRAGRDSGDSLKAAFVAVSPDAIAPGMADAGLVVAAPHPWSFGGDEQISGSVHHETASVHLSVSGNGVTGNSWTFGPEDIRVAARIEAALADADWIRFWL